MKPKLKKILFSIIAVAFWILVWEAAAGRVGSTLLLPTPRSVIATLWRLLGTAQFYEVTWNSLRNVLSGILIAILIGSVLAILTSRIAFIRELVFPLMAVVKATPVASFIVLLLIFIGAASVPTIITVLIVLPVVWTNLDEGLRRKNKELEQVAIIYRMSILRKLRFLILPSLRPYFVSACRTSLGLAWKAGIAAEIIAMPRQSIGRLIGEARLYLLTDEMFAWTLTVVLLSLLIELGFVSLLNRLEKRLPEKEEATE